MEEVDELFVVRVPPTTRTAEGVRGWFEFSSGARCGEDSGLELDCVSVDAFTLRTIASAPPPATPRRSSRKHQREDHTDEQRSKKKK